MTVDQVASDSRPQSARALAFGLGRLGIWSGAPRFAPDGAGLRATVELEQLGYAAVWVPGGIDDGVLAALEPLLDATSTIKLCTGILNIWKHEPADVAAWFAARSPEHRARLMLALGVSHAGLIGEAYQKPFSKMREFLDGLEEAGMDMAHVSIGAHGPKTLKMAAERTAGSHPYLVSARHTAEFREALGPDALLAPEVGVVLETDPAKARAIGREMVGMYLSFPNYTNNWERHGFSKDEIATMSDGLIDSLIVWGDLGAIARGLDAHYAAGADHICVQVITPGAMMAPITDQIPVWRELAKLL